MSAAKGGPKARPSFLSKAKKAKGRADLRALKHSDPRPKAAGTAPDPHKKSPVSKKQSLNLAI
ncbi:hypothetical protein SGRA_1540 [Saprospira grandis str. Lewin]|uniref:Uncharacterized protein n=1 Tax=Saprospira grandis (strain Lewin) TaxID=984262 RepID=H6L9A3_SAPGL|nr:hypothetical protein SGRA_1540 [Saprospira grandis str. Lewin]